MEPQLGLVQPQATDLAAEEMASVEKLQQGYHNMKSELGKVIVGQEQVIEELLIALFCKGHALLVGVPGTAGVVRRMHHVVAAKQRVVQWQRLYIENISGQSQLVGQHACA